MLVLPTKLTHDEAPACMRMLQKGLADAKPLLKQTVSKTAEELAPVLGWAPPYSSLLLLTPPHSS